MSSRKFILNSTELGRVTLENDPLGWDTVKKVFTRNLIYIGVFRKRTASLKFIGDGLDYCVSLFNIRGTEAIMNVIVMQKVDYEDAWELEYEGIGKFNPFDLEWDDDLSPSLSIEFEDSGFHNKFLTRINMEVNLGQQFSVEGLDVGIFPSQNIQVHQRSIKENNNFVLSEANAAYYHYVSSIGEPYISSPDGHVIPAEKIDGDTDFVQTPTDYLLATPGLMCEFVDQPTAFKMRFSIAGSGNTRAFAPIVSPEQVGWYVRKFLAGDINVFTDTLLSEVAGIPPGGGIGVEEPFAFDFDGTLDIVLNVDEAFTIVCVFDHNDPGDTGPKFYDIVYTECTINLELIQNFDEYISKCHYRHELMKRNIQLITDQSDCFKSNVFGRTDIGYVSNGRYWNNVAFSGKQLRGFSDAFPIRSFEKNFKSVKSIFNVGCGIEKFGSKYKVVVEELPHFFRGDISITLHNVTKVKRGISEQFTFSEARVGYEKSEYEQVNGLEEYNNKSIFATYIKSNENILDLISPDRADGYGMEFARRKNIKVASSEDTPYDNEVFTAQVVKDGELLRTIENEGFTNVSNINSPETATNLDITPQRNLKRNGDWISGCCYKFPDEVVKFLSSDKTSDLSTQKTGETEPVIEQVDILNSKLLSSLWLNLEYPFEAAITPEQVRAMELKPHSLIKFSPFSREQTTKYFYGWVLEANVGGKERKGTFRLLAANINSDRLVIIDPDGIYNPDPTTPLPPGPPGETEFGYEYGFEKLFEV